MFVIFKLISCVFIFFKEFYFNLFEICDSCIYLDVKCLNIEGDRI